MNIQHRSLKSVEGLSDSIHPVIRQLYAARGAGCDSDVQRSTKDLIHYQHLKGVEQAAQILADAIQQQRTIIVVGDFDADGATSTALMIRALRSFGCEHCDYLVPNRFQFGYGLSPEIVALAHERGAELIVTVDNGISCVAGVERAKQLGMTVVITDHHLPGKDIPPADAIVNPNQRGCDFPSKNLAGVGVAFYLMMALRAQLQRRDWFANKQLTVPVLGNLLDLVALGTVADVVKLDTNNRILVHQGLQRIRAKQCHAGINALLKVAERLHQDIDAAALGFVLGPRLNAAGRLDDMSLGIQCLLADSDYPAIQLAAKLDRLNSERREIETSMQRDAEAAMQKLALTNNTMPCGLVLFDETWHQGIIGILAGRLKDKYYRPTIAFAAQDEHLLKGSARSIPGLHIRDVLDAISKRYPAIIDKFGGHAAAAGLTIARDKLAAFIPAFDAVCTEWLQEASLENVIVSDGSLRSDCFTMAFAQQLKAAGPWGQGFPEPLFDDEFEIVQQRIVATKHLKLVLAGGDGELFDAIAFNADLSVWPNSAKRARVAYRLDINRFRQQQSLQLLVTAIEVQFPQRSCRASESGLLNSEQE